MVSTKPYLIRAIYEWCADQGFTPYLAAQVDERTRVPSGYVRDGQIVLNIGADATHQLVMDNEQITFQARFNGVAHHIVVPVDNVAAIYARENGQGMAFEVQLPAVVGVTVESGRVEKPDDDDLRPPPPPPPRGSHLKVIK
jgi:stringent starvation protein B